MNYGNSIPSSSKADIYSDDVWTGSKLIVLEKGAKQNKLKKGNYTMMIYATEGCFVEIITKSI